MPVSIRTALLATAVCGSFLMAPKVESAIVSAMGLSDREAVERVRLDAGPVSKDLASASLAAQVASSARLADLSKSSFAASISRPSMPTFGSGAERFAFAVGPGSRFAGASHHAFPNAAGLSGHPVFGSSGHPLFGSAGFFTPSGPFAFPDGEENGLGPITNPIQSLEPGVNEPSGQAGGGSNPLVVASAESAVPEPSTWSLLLLGFASLGLALRRNGAATRRTAQT